jgi:DNA repair photolyase
MTLKAIYWVTGKPEYAKLGLNCYTGCSHNCGYCYNAFRFHGSWIQPRPAASLNNIQHDLIELHEANDKTPVHLSFVGDPYDMGRTDNSFMHSVLKLFRLYDHPFIVLTKGGMLATKDFDLYGPNDSFGVTLTLDNDVDSKKYEPGAAFPTDRIEALKEAHSHGIRTWVSMEPVLYPAQTMNLIQMTHEFVDLFWVGKLNHNAAFERTVVWPRFRSDVEALLQKCGKQQGTGYRIKRKLIEAK